VYLSNFSYFEFFIENPSSTTGALFVEAICGKKSKANMCIVKDMS